MINTPTPTTFDRRSFLRTAVATAAGAALASTVRANQPAAQGAGVSQLRAAPMERVRVGVIGLGNRGFSMLPGMSQLDWVDITAVSDKVSSKVDRAISVLEKEGRPAPARFDSGPDSWRELCGREDVDVVYICTPWHLHVPMSVAAMEAGKHAFVEVPAAVTIEEAWQLVDTAERTQKHCAMLENVCYGQSELTVLNMVQNGVFGTLTHAEAAYIHDLRDLHFSPTVYEDMWRMKYCQEVDANLYPTHGLGPVAWYMDINRGDRFDYLVSISSRQAGMTEYAQDKFGHDSAEAKQTYKLGDMNTSIIKTALGRSIMVQHDVTSPRPYSRLNLLSGTKATFAGFPDRLATAPDSHSWLEEGAFAEMLQQHAHPLWKSVGEIAQKVGGHGGMDFVMIYRLFDCLRRGLPLDLSVYDAAAWSAVFPLSQESNANRGSSVDVPDFTRGAWKTTPRLAIEP